ncbi:hypothetical protein GCK32_008946 [Trichostrongylus colubriformis]|uniref:Uncharacterized protein n=1 Tax=Trichostrongylus colubriformis TaxID=6319 RepID=A0AAN8FVL6_TRICO
MRPGFCRLRLPHLFEYCEFKTKLRSDWTEETVSEEDVDEEEEHESSSERKSSQSSTSSAESEPDVVTSNWTRRLWGPNAHQLSTDTIIATPSPPSRPSQLPPLVDARSKPKITSIRSIDFDIPG